MSNFRQAQDSARSTSRWLIWLFALAVIGTVAIVNAALAIVWRLQLGGMFRLPPSFYEVNTAATLGLILCGTLLEMSGLRKGGGAIAERLGGMQLKRPSDDLEQRLFNVAHEMAVATGLKVPPIYILQSDLSINAFAAGWERSDCVVAVTRGALLRLSRDELQGVIAHEYSHILNHDTQLSTRLAGYVAGLSFVWGFGSHLAHMTDARGNHKAWALMGYGIMMAGSAGWLAGRLLRAAVSRQREYLADASAIQFTRNPHGIGGALRKIAGHPPQPGTKGLQAREADAMSHMFIAPACTGVLHRWFALHPPIQRRLERIFGRRMPAAPSSESILAEGDRVGFVTPAAAAGIADRSEVVQIPPLYDVPGRPPFLIPLQEQALVRLRGAKGSVLLHALVMAALVSRGEPAKALKWKLALPVGTLESDPVHVEAVNGARDLARLPWLVVLPLLESWARNLQPLDQAARTQIAFDADSVSRSAVDQAAVWAALMVSVLVAGEEIGRGGPAASLATIDREILCVVDGIEKAMLPRRRAAGCPKAWRASVLSELGLKSDTEVDQIATTPLRRALVSLRAADWRARALLIRTLFRNTKLYEGPDFDGGQAVVALRCLCAVLETPMPPAMAGAFIE